MLLVCSEGKGHSIFLRGCFDFFLHKGVLPRFFPWFVALAFQNYLYSF